MITFGGSGWAWILGDIIQPTTFYPVALPYLYPSHIKNKFTPSQHSEVLNYYSINFKT